MNIQHSAFNHSFGIPKYLSVSINILFNYEVHDVCTSERFNKSNKFKHISTVKTNGLTDVWKSRNIYCNPPGKQAIDGGSKSLTKDFWNEINKRLIDDRIDYSIWLGYSIEQLQTLQQTPYSLKNVRSILIFNERVKFIDENGIEQSSPTHGNFIALLGKDAVMDEKFVKFFRLFGTAFKPF